VLFCSYDWNLVSNSRQTTAYAATSWAIGDQHGARVYYRAPASHPPDGSLGILISPANPSDANSFISWSDNGAITATLHPLTKMAAANSYGTKVPGSPVFFQTDAGNITSWCNDASTRVWSDLDIYATSTVPGTGIGALSYGNAQFTEFDVYFTDASGNLYEVRKRDTDTTWGQPVQIWTGASIDAHIGATVFTDSNGETITSSTRIPLITDRLTLLF
jgi:hypothetical protein